MVLLFAGFQITLYIKMEINTVSAHLEKQDLGFVSLRRLPIQYLVVKVKEVGVLFTDVCLRIGYQLTNIPADKQERQK